MSAPRKRAIIFLVMNGMGIQQRIDFCVQRVTSKHMFRNTLTIVKVTIVSNVTIKGYWMAIIMQHQKNLSSFKEINCLVEGELGYTLDQQSYNYVTNKDRIKMICSNNHKYEVEYSHSMQGKKCRKCGYDNWRLSEDEVKTEG